MICWFDLISWSDLADFLISWSDFLNDLITRFFWMIWSQGFQTLIMPTQSTQLIQIEQMSELIFEACQFLWELIFEAWQFLVCVSAFRFLKAILVDPLPSSRDPPVSWPSSGSVICCIHWALKHMWSFNVLSIVYNATQCTVYCT